MTTLLVVDDSAADRQLAGQLLERHASWVAVYAENGLRALERLQEQPAVDLVLTDLLMPELDGLGLVARITEEHPHVPVVLMTGRGSEEVAVQALKAGAASYVPKKALVRELVEVVDRLLAVSRERDTDRQLPGQLREASFVLDNDLDMISSLVRFLAQAVRGLEVFDESECHHVASALDEALTNAYYHGNLEVPSALREGDLFAYRAAAQQRADAAPYRDRRIHVTARFSSDHACFVVRDDGKGFDLTGVGDPTHPDFITRPAGRGIFLMRAFMNEVRFNTTGNEVTMLKRRRRVHELSVEGQRVLS